MSRFSCVRNMNFSNETVESCWMYKGLERPRWTHRQVYISAWPYYARWAWAPIHSIPVSHVGLTISRSPSATVRKNVSIYEQKRIKTERKANHENKHVKNKEKAHSLSGQSDGDSTWDKKRCDWPNPNRLWLVGDWLCVIPLTCFCVSSSGACSSLRLGWPPLLLSDPEVTCRTTNWLRQQLDGNRKNNLLNECSRKSSP